MEQQKVEKSVITSVRTDCEFDTRCLINFADEMNRRMEKNIRRDEGKINAGLKKARKMLTL